jgi:hypothetical protein
VFGFLCSRRPRFLGCYNSSHEIHENVHEKGGRGGGMENLLFSIGVRGDDRGGNILISGMCKKSGQIK